MEIKNIEKYNIYLKLSLILYIINTYFTETEPYYLLTFVLVYICLNISYFIFGKEYILVISSITSLAMSISITPLASILYSVNIIELLINNKNRLIMIILILLPAFYNKETIIVYIILTTISYTFLSLYNNFIINTKNMDIEIENKRKAIYRLSNIVEKSEEVLKQVVHTTKLEERNKLSQSIHDKVGHTIAASLMQLEAIKIVMNNDRDKSKGMLDNTIKVLRVGMDDIRKVLRDISPQKEEIGINQIKLLLEEKTKNTNFNFSLIHNGNLEKLSKKQWIYILDIMREASTNSMKYSQGNKINIKIEVLNKLIKLEINDNGMGCDKINKGIGLSSIEQKVLDLGGKLIIDSNNRFSINILLPIESEDMVLA